jgi:hypothetical protein
MTNGDRRPAIPSRLVDLPDPAAPLLPSGAITSSDIAAVIDKLQSVKKARYQIGSHSFNSGQELRELLTDLQCRGPGVMTHRAVEFMRALIQARHPFPASFHEMTGCELVVRGASIVFEVVLPAERRVVRKDRLINPPTLRARLVEACRTAARPQIDEFRAAYFRDTPEAERRCPFTGYPITQATCDVDHEAPITFTWIFRNAFRGWSAAQIDALATNALEHHPSSDTTQFADWKRADGFADFHRSHARLRVLHKFTNRVLLKAPDDEEC